MLLLRTRKYNLVVLTLIVVISSLVTIPHALTYMERNLPVTALLSNTKYPTGVIHDYFIDDSWGVFPVDLYYPAMVNGETAPPYTVDAPYSVVIFAHGYGGSKDYYEWIGCSLAGHGFIVGLFTVPNRLRLNIWQPVAGIEGAIDYLDEAFHTSEHILRGVGDINRLGVIVHSFGAGAAIVAGSKDHRIKAVIALAPPGRTQIRSLGAVGELLTEKIHNPIGEIEKSAQVLTAPLQIQVGSLDRLCPPSETRFYYDECQCTRDFFLIEGGNHVQFTDYGVTLGGVIDNSASISMEEQHQASFSHMLVWLNRYLQQ